MNATAYYLTNVNAECRSSFLLPVSFFFFSFPVSFFDINNFVTLLLPDQAKKKRTSNLRSKLMGQGMRLAPFV